MDLKPWTGVHFYMSIRSYVALVVASACLMALAVALLSASPSVAELGAIACFVIIGVLSHALLYRTAGSSSGSVAFIPFLAAAALSPTWITLVGVAGTVALVEYQSKRALLKALFNVAQFSVAVSVAILTLIMFGARSPLTFSNTPPASIVAYAVSFVLFLLTNSVAVSGAIAISERRKLNEVWRTNAISTALYDLISLPFAYGYAKIYAELGAGWAMALAVPLLGLRHFYRINWQLERTNRELLQLMVKAIEARDPYTSGHSRRVAEYATIIARAVGIKPKLVERIGMAALMHDVGKIHEDFAPILRKPSALTSDERAIMESHSERGAQLVATVSQLEDLVPIIRHHHERWDGTGYPARISGDGIPLGARIIMLADTIDAMTSDRPYRAALGEREVLSELTRMSGRQFDPHLCAAFLRSGAQLSLFDAVRRARADTSSSADQKATRRDVVALTA